MPMEHISISPGNSKMGSLNSVSLPSVITCGRRCEHCYAEKIEKLRPSVHTAYMRNLSILQNNPDQYWSEVSQALKTSRFFRFHVSGDIPDMDYLERMVNAARENPWCEILCFTKRYNFVNSYLDNGNTLPPNLHLILSAWRGLKMENPYDLPEAHVNYKDGMTTARKDAKPCGGNCFECASTDCGCWVLKNGEQVVFHEH